MEVVGLAGSAPFSPLEEGGNCKLCGLHVLRILAKIDHYVEIFPAFDTHMLSPYVITNVMFSKCQNRVLLPLILD